MSDDPKKFPRAVENMIADFLSVPREGGFSRKRPTLDVNTWIQQLLNKHQIGRESPEHTIREHWKEIAGSNAHYSHPAQIDTRGRLVVLASHSVVRNELFHHRALIVEKIRLLPGCEHIREINVRAG